MKKSLIQRLNADRAIGRDAGARPGFYRDAPHGPGGVAFRLWPGLAPRTEDAAGLARRREGATMPPPARLVRDGLGVYLSRAEYVQGGGV